MIKTIPGALSARLFYQPPAVPCTSHPLPAAPISDLSRPTAVPEVQTVEHLKPEAYPSKTGQFHR